MPLDPETSAYFVTVLERKTYRVYAESPDEAALLGKEGRGAVEAEYETQVLDVQEAGGE